MKNLIISVVSGLFVGLFYMGVILLVSSPLILLTRMGFLLGDAETIVGQILGESLLQFTELGTSTIIVIIVQILLSLAACIVTFIFLAKVLNALLSDKDEIYFRTLFKIVFLIVLIVPEILTIMTIFLQKMPFKVLLIIDACLVAVVFTFSTILSNKILPDVMNAQNKKYLFGEKRDEE